MTTESTVKWILQVILHLNRLKLFFFSIHIVKLVLDSLIVDADVDDEKINNNIGIGWNAYLRSHTKFLFSLFLLYFCAVSSVCEFVCLTWWRCGYATTVWSIKILYSVGDKRFLTTKNSMHIFFIHFHSAFVS